MFSESARTRVRLLAFLCCGIWALSVLFFYYRLMWHFWPQLSLSSMPLQWHALGPALWDDLRHILSLLWIVGVAALWGRWTFQYWGISFLSRFDYFWASVGLGFGEIMGALFVLGIAGLWFPALLVGVFLLASVTGVLLNRDLYQGIAWNSFSRASLSLLPQEEKDGWNRLFVFSIGLQLLFLFIHALSPETSYDALVYHLAIPQLWLLHHRIIPTPTYCFSGIPFNTELVYGLCLALNNEITAKLVHFVMGLGTLSMLYTVGRRLLNARAGLAAVLIFLCPPMIALEFARAAVDLTTTFYTVLVAWVLLMLLDAGEAERRRLLSVLGLFAGLAMGTKYTAWVLVGGLMGALYEVGKTAGLSFKKYFSEIGQVFLMAALVLSPWIFRNIGFYRNPIFPFLHQVFQTPGSSIPNWAALRGEGARNWGTILHSWHGFRQFLIDPWRITMGRSTGYDYLGPIDLALLPLLIVISQTQYQRRLMGFFLGLFIPAYMVSFYPRFWLPALSILSVLLGVGLCHPAVPRFLRQGLLIALLGVGGFNAIFSNRSLMQLDSWRVVFGQLSKMENLNEPHPSYYSPYYRMAQYVNAIAPVDAHLFLLGDARGFYYQRPYVGASKFDSQPVFRWANDCATGDALYQKFKTEGLAYIVFNAAEAGRMRPAWHETFSPSGEKVFADFWEKHIRFVRSDQAVTSEGVRSVFLYTVQDKVETLAPPNIFLQMMKH